MPTPPHIAVGLCRQGCIRWSGNHPPCSGSRHSV